MAEYLPPSENLPIFDVTVFRNDNPYSDIYLARQGLATSEAVSTSFSGEVNFNNISTPPHCSAVPIQGNDLANKAYVDALAPQTSYIVFLNWTQTYTTPTPTIYKKLNPDENYTPTTVAIATTNLTPVLIGGFFNSKAALLFADVIPPGNWNLVLFANCATATDQNHLELNYSLIGVTAAGVETVIATSAYSNTINVIAPAIGTYSCQLTLPSTSILAYTDIGIKVYVRSNINANRDGNIFFQYTSSYSSLQTSFGTTQASNILTTNNTWTGINTFNNTTNLNSTVIQSGTLTFPDATTQSTAFKALTPGSFTNTDITVDANGAISSIANGTVPSTNAVSIDLTPTASGTGFFIPYSATSGAASTLLSGGITYNRSGNYLTVNVTNSINLTGGAAGQIPWQSAATTTGFIAAGTSGQVLSSNGTGAPTWVNDIPGNSATSTAVALTGDDTSGDWFIPFSKTSSATSNVLYIDNTTTPLTYNASTSTLSSAAYTIGSRVQTAGTNSSLIRQSGVLMDHINNATSGRHRFYVYDSVPAQINAFNIDALKCDTTVPLNVVTTITATLPSLTVKQSSSTQTINFTPFAPVSTLNPITNADSSIISCNGGGATRRLVITTDSATTVGIRMSDSALIIGAGGTANNPSHYIGFGALGVNINSSLVPTITGYAVPAGSDSSTNIATTAWVQSAIPLGTSALATNVVGGVIGNVLYQSATNVTAELVNGAAGTVLTSGGVGAIPSWSANIAGNAGSATKALLSNTATGATNYLVMSATISGNSDLLTDTSGATYDSTTNTAVINVSGNAATATNMTGGVIGNVLYQAAAGSTTRMVNGAAGTILTSGGVGAIPTWSSTFSGTSTTATNAVNSGITNDLVSATSHALTFVSNTTGNLPIKTRANVGTGEGLTYIPSTNQLTCSIAGVGKVVSSNFTLKNSTAEEAELLNLGGTLFISNKGVGDPITISTADAGTGTVNARMQVTQASTNVINKLQTDAGIIGPSAVLTYATDMIGYTTSFNGNGANVATTSLTWYAMTVTGFTFPSPGVWLVHMFAQATTSAAAGNILFCNGGLSSTSGVAPTGVGSFEISFNQASYNTPAVAGYCGGTASWVSTITSSATTYFFNIRWQNTTTVITLARTLCKFALTRIA